MHWNWPKILTHIKRQSKSDVSLPSEDNRRCQCRACLSLGSHPWNASQLEQKRQPHAEKDHEQTDSRKFGQKPLWEIPHMKWLEEIQIVNVAEWSHDELHCKQVESISDTFSNFMLGGHSALRAFRWFKMSTSIFWCSTRLASQLFISPRDTPTDTEYQWWSC